MPKVFNLCIRLVWLCHHKMVMVLQKQHIPFWLGDQIAIYVIFCRKNDLRTLFVAKNDLRTFFVAKTINALCPESFCMLNFAVWKVQTFWASWGGGSFPNNLNQILGWSRMSSSWFTFLSNQSNILYVSAIKLVSQSDQTNIVQQSFFIKTIFVSTIIILYLSCVNVYLRNVVMRRG